MNRYNTATEKQTNTLIKAGYSTRELEGLTKSQASKLLDYVSRNNWTRPNVAQVEAIVGGELLEEDKAAQPVLIMARVPTWVEVGEFTKDMSNEQGFAIEEGIAELVEAVKRGKEALIQHGLALARLKTACSRGDWTRLLKFLNVPRTTAHRQIQLARAQNRIDAKLQTQLELKGIKFTTTMTVREVQIVQKTREVAEEAEKEAVQTFHGGTFETEKGDFAGPVEAWAQLVEQRKRFVDERVETFVDSQLQPKPRAELPDATVSLHLVPAAPISVAIVARRIATFAVDELRTCPRGMQNDVWESAVRFIEAEAGVEVKELEVANARG